MSAVRLAARLAVPALVVGQLLVLAPPAHAASTPWRFSPRQSATFYINANSLAAGYATCPSGYIPIGGGIESVSDMGSFERVAEYRNGAQYVVIGHNYSASLMSVTVAASCALDSQVGSLTLVSGDFGSNASGLGGGTVTCPTGMLAITGAADWNFIGSNNRRVDLMSPSTNGQGWYAAGWSPVSSSLHVEAYCAPAGWIGVTPVVSTTYFSVSYERPGQGLCPPGTRTGSGGLILSGNDGVPTPGTWRGETHVSYPSTNTTYWTSSSHIEAGTRGTWVTWCLPASRPVVTITQHPPARSNDLTPTFAFTATEPTGEAMSISCHIDEGPVYDGCPSDGTPKEFLGQSLPDGQHVYYADATNTSGQHVWASYAWVVDTTAPTATGPAASPAITAPLSVTFNEPVTGVSASSFQVRVTGQSTVLAGTVSVGASGTTASWTPASPLVPGESYTVSLGSPIADVAGNALAPVTFAVRASGVVQNTSPALRESWDRDTASAASGGAYIVSNLSGTSATWRVAVAAGQTVAVHGVRLPTGGYGDVYLDGVKKATLSFYASSPAYQVKLWTSAALAAGTHSVQVRVLGTKPSGSQGTDVALDHLRNGTTTVAETAAVQAFRRVATTAASGGSYDVVTHRGDAGGAPSYSLTFKGTAVKLYVTKSAGSGSARIYVDGVGKATVSLSSGSTQYQQLAFSLAGLSSTTRHTILVVAAGTTTGATSAVAVDYLSVT
ncbi:MAG TPA: Ig-like domain-containing protein [Mycobacteriales bacterium]|jgi:hypothetical protein|nr:Ig-like domain-containing protein [Mycobacteriales bacterium]